MFCLCAGREKKFYLAILLFLMETVAAKKVFVTHFSLKGLRIRKYYNIFWKNSEGLTSSWKIANKIFFELDSSKLISIAAGKVSCTKGTRRYTKLSFLRLAVSLRILQVLEGPHIKEQINVLTKKYFKLKTWKTEEDCGF